MLAEGVASLSATEPTPAMLALHCLSCGTRPLHIPARCQADRAGTESSAPLPPCSPSVTDPHVHAPSATRAAPQAQLPLAALPLLRQALPLRHLVSAAATPACPVLAALGGGPLRRPGARGASGVALAALCLQLVTEWAVFGGCAPAASLRTPRPCLLAGSEADARHRLRRGLTDSRRK